MVKTSAMSILLMVILAAASVSDAQVLRAGPCPKITPMPLFNASAAMGTWYEQIHTKRWSGLDIRCNTEIFTLISPRKFTFDSFTYSQTADRTFYESGEIEVVKSGVGHLKVKVTGDDVKTDLWVLGTDYKGYAVLWTCSNSDDMHLENVMILTREKHSRTSSLMAGLKVLDSSNISRSYLKYTRHGNCPDFAMMVTSSASSTAASMAKGMTGAMGTTVKMVMSTTAQVTVTPDKIGSKPVAPITAASASSSSNSKGPS